MWDDTLCYLLSPALASYELERSVGVSAGNEEFQDAVRGYVPEGHTFKGFPIQLTHRSTHRAFNTCLRYIRLEVSRFLSPFPPSHFFPPSLLPPFPPLSSLLSPSRSPVCSEIASCRGDHVRLAVRVKIYCYPEDITAVWIMFAVVYRCIL